MFDESKLHAMITGMKTVRSWGDDAMAGAAKNSNTIWPSNPAKILSPFIFPLLSLAKQLQ